VTSPEALLCLVDQNLFVLRLLPTAGRFYGKLLQINVLRSDKLSRVHSPI
jgi:hypothetical protein